MKQWIPIIFVVVSSHAYSQNKISAERIIAIGQHYDEQGILTDSINFAWIGQRGVAVDFENRHLFTILDSQADTTVHWNTFENKLQTRSRLIQHFDINNLCTEKIFQGMNQLSMQWYYTTRTEYLNDGNRILTLTNYTYNKDLQVWEKSDKFSYTYSNEQRQNELYQEWDNKSESWINYAKVDRIFKDHLVTEDEAFFWEKGAWVSNRKWNFFYTNDKVSYYLARYIDQGNGSAHKGEYSYDGDNIKSIVLRKWDGNTGDYTKNSSLDLNEYKDGKLIAKVSQIWRDDNNEWRNGSRKEYHISNNLVTEEVNFRWSELEEKWLASSKETFTYTKYGNLKSAVLFYWNNTLNDWDPQVSNTSYHYEEYDKVVPNPEDREITLSPTPATTLNEAYLDFISEKTETIQVTMADATGKQIIKLEQKYNAGKNFCKIPLNGLQSGMYIIRVSFDGIFTRSLKLVR